MFNKGVVNIEKIKDSLQYFTRVFEAEIRCIKGNKIAELNLLQNEKKLAYAFLNDRKDDLKAILSGGNKEYKANDVDLVRKSLKKLHDTAEEGMRYAKLKLRLNNIFIDAIKSGVEQVDNECKIYNSMGYSNSKKKMSSAVALSNNI